MIAICLVLNALFAAVEMAFVTVTKSRLRELARVGNRDAARILGLRDNPERTLSIIQVGITIVGSAAAAVGGVGAMSTISPWLQAQISVSESVANSIAIIAVVLPITYVNVVLGELVPKTLALKNPLAIVLASARWLTLFDRVLSPAVSLLEASTKIVLRFIETFLKPMKALQSGRAPVAVEEFERPKEGVELEHLSHKTREYVLNLVDLEHKRIRDVRLPWSSVLSVQMTDSADEVEKVVFASGHTRLPVMNGEEAVGILNTKEFIVLNATSGQSDWRNLVRPVVRVDEGSPILRALRRMQDQRSHLSITFKNGVISGIVTIEDIFEEIIGDIFDEDDDGKLRRVLSTAARIRSYAATSQTADL